MKGWPLVWRGAAFLLILISIFQPTLKAWAHPIDMYAQTQAITISTDEIQIVWKITPGPLLADAIWSAADQDKNGSISTQETQAWTAAWLSSLSVSFDNQNIGYTQNQRGPLAGDGGCDAHRRRFN